MATYVDYDYYENTFQGDQIPQTEFDKWALRASKKIDRFTFNRADAIITDDEPADEVTAIKKATCEVADELYKQDQAFYSGMSVKSESVGGHSVSYADNPDVKRSMLEKQREAARIWLEETYLMFPGFYSGEYGTIVEELED